MTIGHWLTPDGLLAARAEHDDRLHALQAEAVPEGAPMFLPAPVDLHVHGAGGVDAMGGEAALRRMLQVQASLGCGALLATSVCAPFEAIDAFLADVATVMAAPDAGAATLLGAHLEGPFINPEKLGAQPPHAAAVDLAALERWLATGVVRVVTFAPELDDADALIRLCARHGALAQIGHTLCDWATAQAALAAGCGVTHLWNAMSGAAHRGGGAVLAALAHAAHAEIICDGLHVDRAAFEAARRSIPGLYSVTDGTAAVGMPDGEYTLGSHRVVRHGASVRLADGTLAGSCLDQIGQLAVLRDWGLDWPAVAELVSARPAVRIGLDELGRIGPGARAHWLELAGERPVALWLDGERRALVGTSERDRVGAAADVAATASSAERAPAARHDREPVPDVTESVEYRPLPMDRLPTPAVIERILAGQARAVHSVAAVGGALADAVDAAAVRLADGNAGRLVMLGAGASGRLAVQDGAELWPTFGWPAERLVLSIAGGEGALLHSVEGAEDDAGAARAEAAALSLGAHDVVLAVAASGRSPWSVAWLERARTACALCIAMAGNADTPLLRAADHPLLLDSGPEPLAGSTRMGAGTAQKAALNAFSTALMVRLNRSHDNLMVDMAAVNEKLDRRRVAMLRTVLPEIDEAAARAALDEADGWVKLAVLVALGDRPEAGRQRLERAAGSLREALAARD